MNTKTVATPSATTTRAAAIKQLATRLILDMRCGARDPGEFLANAPVYVLMDATCQKYDVEAHELVEQVLRTLLDQGGKHDEIYGVVVHAEVEAYFGTCQPVFFDPRSPGVHDPSWYEGEFGTSTGHLGFGEPSQEVGLRIMTARGCGMTGCSCDRERDGGGHFLPTTGTSYSRRTAKARKLLAVAKKGAARRAERAAAERLEAERAAAAEKRRIFDEQHPRGADGCYIKKER